MIGRFGGRAELSPSAASLTVGWSEDASSVSNRTASPDTSAIGPTRTRGVEAMRYVRFLGSSQ